jgi:hypothetical protein
VEIQQEYMALQARYQQTLSQQASLHQGLFGLSTHRPGGVILGDNIASMRMPVSKRSVEKVLATVPTIREELQSEVDGWLKDVL